MPLSDKKASPFSAASSTGKMRAFKVVASLAAASFLCMIAGIYIDFIRTPAINAVFYPSQTEQILDREKLINPQPPQNRPIETPKTPEAEEDLRLIKRLEKEQENVKQTAEAFREIVESTTEDIRKQEVLPEKQEIRDLQQEKDAAEQKKLDEIEALNTERLAAEKKAPEQKDENLPPVYANEANKTKEVDLPKEGKDVETKEKAVSPSGPETTAAAFPPSPSGVQELPQPDLIQTNLMASLPDFSLIKKGPASNIIPLHIIDPLPELQEESRYGKLPVEKNGKTPFSAYGKTLEFPPTTPYIAILFSGLGKRDNVTQTAIASLPDTISLSFSPYTEKFKTYVSDARKSGHETLIDLPMQRGVFPETDPGPLGLVSGLPEQENRKRLRKVLGQDVAFIGITATANENFSYSGTQMKPFLDEIIRRGLIYIDGTDDPRMPVYPTAIRPDVHISGDFHRAAIRARLEAAKKTALEKGAAFIRIETVPITMLTVIEWMRTFTPTEKNPVPEISFVPLSYYVSQKRGKK